MNPFAAYDIPFEGIDDTARVIVIEDLDLDLFIGVYESEKAARQRVRVTAEILVVPAEPAHGDRIDKVVSYAGILDAIVALAGQPHVELQETLAEAVARLCLEPAEAMAARVHVRKLDVYAGCRSVGIRILRRKSG